jgi:signal transduction histidine kinase/ActR/RegA family two-component response regulator
MLTRFLGIGQRPGESHSDQLSRRVLLAGGALMSGGGVLWGTIALACGATAAASIPFAYIAITATNFIVFAAIRNFEAARLLQVLASLLLPFIFQWALGGFSNSGAVMLWAMVSLVGSLTFSAPRQAIGWLVLYCLLTVVSGGMDEGLRTTTELSVSDGTSVLFSCINIVTISAIVFGLTIHLTSRRQQLTDALAAEQKANRALNERLTEAIGERERDIVALTAAQAELSARTEALRIAMDEASTARQRAEEAARTKAMFLANMSHEIRTPMNAIIGLSHLVLDAEVPPEQRELVQRIHRSGTALLGILNDILDVTKLEAGKVELEKIPFSIDEVIEHALSLVQQPAAEKKLKVYAVIPEVLPVPMIGDPLRLGQVFLNLLSNAVKFTAQGEVVVTVGAVPTGDRTLRLEVSVRDTGIGIPPEVRSQLFTPFTQGDAAMTRRFGGTGLGLTICRHLVEAMDGHIGVEPAEGGGTIFRFRVQVERGEVRADGKPTLGRAPPLVTADLAHDDVLRGRRVLLAEDNEVNKLIVVRLLGLSGLTVETVGDGQSAVDRITHDPTYDAILLDVQMPVLSGLEAAQRIRALGYSGPMIAMTAHAFAEDVRAALEAGMNEHIAKPIDPNRLRGLLARFWRGPSEPRSVIGAGGPAIAPAEAGPAHPARSGPTTRS